MLIYPIVLFGWSLSVNNAESEIVPKSLDDPDEWIPLEPPGSPGDEDYWNAHSRQAEAVGLLFAGGSEFPWIVDIRLADTDQELWAVGNLVTYYHVITTCRALWKFVQRFPWDFDNPEKQTFKHSEIDASVNFCSQYLWESYSGRRDDKSGLSHLADQENFDSGGSRPVYGITLHPKWTLNSLEFDIGVVQMTKGIPPKIPKISYLPIPEDLKTGKIVEPDFSVQQVKRWVCYVASFGKNSNNLRSNIALDYKVKYRVYFMDWRRCKEYFKWVCPSTYHFCTSASKRQSPGKLVCFRSHAKVGAICDHDIGAPLVCNGFVFGIVVRGVDFKYCHNLTPLPVIIRRTDFIRQYLDDLIVQLHTLDVKSHSASFYKKPMRLPVVLICLNYVFPRFSFVNNIVQ